MRYELHSLDQLEREIGYIDGQLARRGGSPARRRRLKWTRVLLLRAAARRRRNLRHHFGRRSDVPNVDARSKQSNDEAA